MSQEESQSLSSAEGNSPSRENPSSPMPSFPGFSPPGVVTSQGPTPPPTLASAFPSQEEEPETSEKAADVPSEGKRWYIVQTQASMEERVQASILNNAERMNLKDKIFQVVVPEEEVVELKGSKRVVKLRKLYPGYVFVEMVLDDESWYMVRQVHGVAKFIGNKTRPLPVTDKEMTRVLRQTGVKSEVIKVDFEVGETVRIISGPFRGHTGSISDINASKGTMRALINIFGRDTPVELEFNQAEKL